MSEDYEQLIPVTLIKEYHVCPRIVYFREVSKAPERTTESMEEGKEAHQKISYLEERRKTLLAERKEEVLMRWDNVIAKSSSLGIFGIVDCVIKTKTGYHLIEHKTGASPKKPKENHIYQAVAYAMLAEETLSLVIRDIIIDYQRNRKKFVVPLNEQIRNHVKWTIKQIRKIIDEEYLPPFRLKKYCKVCGYRWICSMG